MNQFSEPLGTHFNIFDALIHLQSCTHTHVTQFVTYLAPAAQGQDILKAEVLVFKVQVFKINLELNFPFPNPLAG